MYVCILFTFIALWKGVPGRFKGMELYPFSKQLYRLLMHSFSKSSIGPKTAIIATSKANWGGKQKEPWVYYYMVFMSACGKGTYKEAFSRKKKEKKEDVPSSFLGACWLSYSPMKAESWEQGAQSRTHFLVMQKVGRMLGPTSLALNDNRLGGRKAPQVLSSSPCWVDM